jgi:hypothetical protein
MVNQNKLTKKRFWAVRLKRKKNKSKLYFNDK